MSLLGKHKYIAILGGREAEKGPALYRRFIFANTARVIVTVNVRGYDILWAAKNVSHDSTLPRNRQTYVKCFILISSFSRLDQLVACYLVFVVYNRKRTLDGILYSLTRSRLMFIG